MDQNVLSANSKIFVSQKCQDLYLNNDLQASAQISQNDLNDAIDQAENRALEHEKKSNLDRFQAQSLSKNSRFTPEIEPQTCRWVSKFNR